MLVSPKLTPGGRFQAASHWLRTFSRAPSASFASSRRSAGSTRFPVGSGSLREPTDVRGRGDVVFQRAMAEMRARAASKALESSPFYVVDLGAVERMHDAWCRLMPGVRPYYAVKCNPDPSIVRRLAACGAGFDCASAFELDLVARALEATRGTGAATPGAEPLTGSGWPYADVAPVPGLDSEVIFGNPCKVPSHMRAADAAGVTRCTFDSESELLKIARYMPRARPVLRVRADDPGARCQLGNKFGAEPADVPALVRAAKHLGLPLHGVSFHVGSAAADPAAFSRALGVARQAADEMEARGMAPSLIDIGGGFSGSAAQPDTTAATAAGTAPTGDADADADAAGAVSIAAVSRHALPLLRELFPAPRWTAVAEPGRLFVEGAQVLATPVIGSKPAGHRRGQRAQAVTCTESLYQAFNCIPFDHAAPHPRPVLSRDLEAGADVLPIADRHLAADRDGDVGGHCAGHGGATLGDGRWRVGGGGSARFASSVADAVHGARAPEALLPTTVYGPTCDGLDCVVEDVNLPALGEGDWLLWDGMGAYTNAAVGPHTGGPGFNGFPRADAVYVDTSSRT